MVEVLERFRPSRPFSPPDMLDEDADEDGQDAPYDHFQEDT